MEDTNMGQQMPQPNLPQNNFQTNPSSNYSYPRKSSVKIISIVSSVVLLVLVAAGIYAYIMKLGPFSNPPYTEENFLSGILNSSSNIDSSSYSVSAYFEMGKRDADAKPFVTKLSNAEEIKKKYERDSRRAQDVRDIMYYLESFKLKGTYLNSLKELKNQKFIYGSSTRSSVENIKDPSTQKEYTYSTTNSGKNFSLTVTFETNNAIIQIKNSYGFSNKTTIINGRNVTFTKDSSRYLYLSSEFPKPVFVALADYLTYVPTEAKVSFSVSAQADWSNKNSENWKFNADATGDFGDLTYKVNVDALRKDNVYYFRVNNIPSLFMGFIEFEKGQWIKIDPSKSSSHGSYLVKGLPEAEKKLKEDREEISNLLKKTVEIADNNNLINFKHTPKSENINGRLLYKYDLEIRKAAILPFYQQLQQEIEKTNLKNSYPVLEDSGFLEYLQSPEFGEVFDYYQKNTDLSIWVDARGFPALVSYNFRIIPQDSVTQLKDKQGNLTFKLELSDINKPADIKAPIETKDIQSGSYYQKGVDASIKGNMATLLVNGEVLYDANKSYSKLCSDENYYLKIKKYIDEAYGSGSKVVCIAQSQKWCASALLASGNYYCVDSKGIKKESSDSNVCSAGECKN